MKKMLLRVDVMPGMWDAEPLAVFVDSSGATLSTLADVGLFARDSDREYGLVVDAVRLDDTRWSIALPGTPFGTALTAVVDDDLIGEELDAGRAAARRGMSYEECAAAGRHVVESSQRTPRAAAWMAFERSGAGTDLTAALVASGVDRDEASLRSAVIMGVIGQTPPAAKQPAT